MIKIEVKKKRIFYFDALRALAIIAVILINIFDGSRYLILNNYSTLPTLNWIIGDFMTNTFRIGVPLFLMLSGALLLGRKWEIKPFLKKRLVRIVLPFLFWSIIFSALFCLLPSFTSINLNLGFLELIYNVLMSITPFYQMWFFWMILGTYLIMPVFNKWILHSELTELEYFLAFWIITCIFDFTLNSISFPIPLSYFTSPIGLVVLGYYLRYTERELFKGVALPIMLIIASSIGMLFFSYIFSTTTELYRFDRYSILVAMEAIGIYLLFKNTNSSIMKNPKGLFKRIIESLSKYSYGIYLVHVPILVLVVNIIPSTNANYLPWILTQFVLVLLLSFGILYLSNKIPFLNEINGAE